MNIFQLLLLWYLCYSLCSCGVQPPTYQPVSFKENTGTPSVIYYPYQNGVQLIELDYTTTRLNIQKENLEASRNLSQQPDEIFALQNHRSSFSPSFNVTPSIFPTLPNAYILRNQDGEIITHYNISKEDVLRHELLSPNEAQQLPVTYHINRQVAYSCLENTRICFFIALKYPYRYKIISDQGMGLIDTLGNVLLEPVYESIRFCENRGQAATYYLEKDNKAILLDVDLNVIIPAKYNKIYPLEGGFYKVEQDTLLGLLDSIGTEIIAPKYKAINTIYKDDYCRVFNGSKWGLVDTLGREVCPLNYDFIGTFDKGFSVVERKYKYGFINTRMEEICNLKYDRVTNFNQGIALVEEGGKQGCINEEGVEIIPCKYRWVYTHRDNEIKVQSRDGIFGLFDKKGTVIIPPIYRRIDTYMNGQCIACKDTVIRSKNGRYTYTKCGLLDRQGNVILPIEYKMVGVFQDGLCAVCQPKDKKAGIKCGFINEQNELVIPYVFDTEMHGLFLNIDTYDWRKTKKFAAYLEKYKALKN